MAAMQQRVQWQYGGDNGWGNFDAPTSTMIETCKNSPMGSPSIQNYNQGNGFTYDINPFTMVQTNLNTGTTRAIRRKVFRVKRDPRIHQRQVAPYSPSAKPVANQQFGAHVPLDRRASFHNNNYVAPQRNVSAVHNNYAPVASRRTASTPHNYAGQQQVSTRHKYNPAAPLRRVSTPHNYNQQVSAHTNGQRRPSFVKQAVSEKDEDLRKALDQIEFEKCFEGFKKEGFYPSQFHDLTDLQLSKVGVKDDDRYAFRKAYPFNFPEVTNPNKFQKEFKKILGGMNLDKFFKALVYYGFDDPETSCPMLGYNDKGERDGKGYKDVGFSFGHECTWRKRFPLKKEETTVENSPVNVAPPAAPVTNVTPAAPVTNVTPAAPVTNVTPAAPVTNVTPAAPVTNGPPAPPVKTTGSSGKPDVNDLLASIRTGKKLKKREAPPKPKNETAAPAMGGMAGMLSQIREGKKLKKREAPPKPKNETAPAMGGMAGMLSQIKKGKKLKKTSKKKKTARPPPADKSKGGVLGQLHARLQGFNKKLRGEEEEDDPNNSGDEQDWSE